MGSRLMPQMEVIAHNFVVIGKGSTLKEANADHDRNFLAFLQLCDKKGLRLNPKKLKLRQSEVSFIGNGLKVDPTKARVIQKMPSPTDKAGVQRLLGLVLYLGMFLPHLTDITKSLRDLDLGGSAETGPRLTERCRDRHTHTWVLQCQRRGHGSV